MAKNVIPIFSAIWLSIVFFAVPVFSCTDFQIKAADGTVIIGRSMEFALDLQSRVIASPRGKEFTGESPDGQQGLSWKSRYGFVGLDAFGLGKVIDGINEKGLAVEGLWLAESEYRQVPPGEEGRALAVEDVGDWILSSFSGVEEVRKALEKVLVWGKFVPRMEGVPPLHLAVHDAAGNNLVVEFLEGRQQIHDNPIGVLTNSPHFDWHLTNLRNYVNLQADNASPVTISGITIKPSGQGSGWRGVPGDWTPPSRFVRTVNFTRAALPAKNASEAVTLAGHILCTVDIPRGVIRDPQHPDIHESTQWIVIKDLTNRVLYFRDYRSFNLRAVDLKKLDFSPGPASGSITVGSGGGIEDSTGKLLNR